MLPRHVNIGIAFPQTEFGSDPIAIRDFTQTAEGLGFDYFVAYDHVIGAGTTSRPDWKGPYSDKDTFQEPLILFSHLAALTKRMFFSTGVVILPQRQTVLFGKQAATLDILCGGRLRLGVGIGWNTVEYEALNVPFEKRGARLDDQIRFLRQFWTTPVFTTSTPFHTLTDAGLNPLPTQRPIPLWVGGDSPAAMARAAKIGDGWMPVVSPIKAFDIIGQFHEAVKREGRDPSRLGFQAMVTVGAHLGRPPRPVEHAAADAETWAKAGATDVLFDAMRNGLSGPAAHMAIMRRFAEAIGLTQRP